MKCDTCGREVTEVRRVVLAKNYDRTRSKPVYNCPECFDAKERTKPYNSPSEPGAAAR